MRNDDIRIKKSSVFAFLVVALITILGLAIAFDARSASAEEGGACYEDRQPGTVWDSCPEGTEVDPGNEGQCRETHTSYSCPVVHFSTSRWTCPNGGVPIGSTCYKLFSNYPATLETFEKDVQYVMDGNKCKLPNPSGVPFWALYDYFHNLPDHKSKVEDVSYSYTERPSHQVCENGEAPINGVCHIQVDCTCIGDQELVDGICVDPTCAPGQYLGEDKVCHEIVCEEGYKLDLEINECVPVVVENEPVMDTIRVFFGFQPEEGQAFEITYNGEFYYNGHDTTDHIVLWLAGTAIGVNGEPMWYVDMPVFELPDNPCLVSLWANGEKIHPVTVDFRDKGGENKWGPHDEFSVVTCTIP